MLYEAQSRVLMGAVALAGGDPMGAEPPVRAAIAAHAHHGNRAAVCEALDVLAAIAAALGDAREAARIVGAVTAHRVAASERAPSRFVALVGPLRGSIDTALGADAAARALAEGATLDLRAVVEIVERSHGTRGRPRLGWGALTPTELQVVELVRQGMSNREIAARLLMGSETVKTHVSHVLTKLGVAKRSQIAVMAAERRGAN